MCAIELVAALSRACPFVPMSFVDSVVVGDTAVHLFGIALPVLLLLVDNAPILLHPSSNLAIQANEQLMGVLYRIRQLPIPL